MQGISEGGRRREGRPDGAGVVGDPSAKVRSFILLSPALGIPRSQGRVGNECTSPKWDGGSTCIFYAQGHRWGREERRTSLGGECADLAWDANSIHSALPLEPSVQEFHLEEENAHPQPCGALIQARNI